MGRQSLESKILSMIMRRVQTKYHCWYMFTTGLPIVRTSSNDQDAFMVFYIDDGILTCKMYFGQRSKVIAEHEIANPEFDVRAVAKLMITKLDETLNYSLFIRGLRPMADVLEGIPKQMKIYLTTYDFNPVH